MLLKIAQDIAIAKCELLHPYCDKLHIAGGIRRLKPDHYDVEIVCLPKTEIQYDMFGTPFSKCRDKHFIETVNNLGKIIKGTANGKMMQIELPGDVMLDLFMPDEEDFYRQYAIRTGSADYSFKVIASAWKKLGWCGSDKGFRKMIDCIETKTPDGKSKWKCVNPKAEKPPFWKTEKAFFDWIKVPFIHPSKRNM